MAVLSRFRTLILILLVLGSFGGIILPQILVPTPAVAQSGMWLSWLEPGMRETFLKVCTQDTNLNVRDEPMVPYQDSSSNVIDSLPSGKEVMATGYVAVPRQYTGLPGTYTWVEVSYLVDANTVRIGWVSAEFLAYACP